MSSRLRAGVELVAKLGQTSTTIKSNIFGTHWRLSKSRLKGLSNMIAALFKDGKASK